MKTIRVYRNPHCAKCAKFARANDFLDWLGRVDGSTETPPTGPLRLGEIVVEEFATGKIHRGAEGVELIWRNIPVYFLLLPLLKIPAFRRYVERAASGCSGDACQMAPKAG